MAAAAPGGDLVLGDRSCLGLGPASAVGIGRRRSLVLTDVLSRSPFLQEEKDPATGVQLSEPAPTAKHPPAAGETGTQGMLSPPGCPTSSP